MTPSRAEAEPRLVARDLRVALDALAAALAGGDAQAILACEPGLQAAIAVRAIGLAAEADRAAVISDIAAARAALARCRAIGTASAQVAGVTLDQLGRTTGYGRHGVGSPRSPRGHDLHARV